MNEDIRTPELYGGEPLYDGFPDDYSARDRTFTVTIAGTERYDGEKPHKYVLEARSTQVAWAEALAWHMVAEETPDCYVVAGESFAGVPAGDVGFQWNDLRAEQKRRRNLDGLAPVPLDRILHRVRLIWPDPRWVLRGGPGGGPSLTWQGGPSVEAVAEELRWPDIDMRRTG
ncbi:hypothetical protein ABZX77_17625 [Streptomyces sp. NPDC004237]|uniref:hypothetical protein n=1 Tax=Streptomyces sp. NPDC004237 TaxID=3154455 RepID=UPI0033A92E65